MEVNLKYLAGLAGVSVSTVSRAIRDDPRVKSETRIRIKKLAEKLNYMPNQTALSLVTGQTRTIGLVLPNIRAFMHDILDGIEEVCSGPGINILLGVYNNDGEKELNELKLLLQKRVDGIILFHIGSPFDYQAKQILDDASVPVILLDRRIREGIYDAVINDNEAGSRLLVDDVVARGLSRIAFIYETEEVTTMKERIEGFNKAMKSHGLEARSEYLVTSPYHKEKNGYEAMEALCRLSDPPEAVIASTGDNILGIVKYLVKNPRLIDRFQISGFDNMDSLDLMRIPITRLDMQEREIGKKAAEMLLRRRDGYGGSCENIVITPKLIRR